MDEVTKDQGAQPAVRPPLRPFSGQRSEGQGALRPQGGRRVALSPFARPATPASSRLIQVAPSSPSAVHPGNSTPGIDCAPDAGATSGSKTTPPGSGVQRSRASDSPEALKPAAPATFDASVAPAHQPSPAERIDASEETSDLEALDVDIGMDAGVANTVAQSLDRVDDASAEGGPEVARSALDISTLSGRSGERAAASDDLSFDQVRFGSAVLRDEPRAAATDIGTDTGTGTDADSMTLLGEHRQHDESAHAETAQAEALHAEASHAETTHVETAHAETAPGDSDTIPASYSSILHDTPAEPALDSPTEHRSAGRVSPDIADDVPSVVELSASVSEDLSTPVVPVEPFDRPSVGAPPNDATPTGFFDQPQVRVDSGTANDATADEKFVIDDSAYAFDDESFAAEIRSEEPDRWSMPIDTSAHSLHDAIEVDLPADAPVTDSPVTDSAVAVSDAAAIDAVGAIAAVDPIHAIAAVDAVDAVAAVAAGAAGADVSPLDATDAGDSLYSSAAEPLVEGAQVASVRMLDAELSDFRLLPEETPAVPTPIPGIEGLLAGAEDVEDGLQATTARTHRSVDDAMDAAADESEHEALNETLGEPLGEPLGESLGHDLGEDFEVALELVDLTSDGGEALPAPMQESRFAADEILASPMSPSAEIAVGGHAAHAEADLQDFVSRSDAREHAAAILEVVARRVRGGDIVPSIDAGASPEAVLASVLATILSQRA